MVRSLILAAPVMPEQAAADDIAIGGGVDGGTRRTAGGNVKSMRASNREAPGAGHKPKSALRLE